MQIKVKHGVQVAKPPAEVFAFLSDPSKMPQWQSTNFEMKDRKAATPQGTLKQGTRVSDRRNVLGKEIDGEWEVVQHDQDKRLVLKVTKGPVPWEMSYTLEPLEGGTFLTAEGGGDMGDLPMSSTAASHACQRLLEDDLATLADILTSSR
jgi:uncharacterized protein YndB with AHSA1/START domain